MIKLALIGYGYWGPNLLRNFEKLNNCKISYLIDTNTQKLDQAKKSYPELNTSTSLSVVLDNPDISAIIIATPVSTHFKIAKSALEHGKHVLIEKPMTDSVQDAEQLIEISQKNNLLLMVDHTYLYAGTIQKLKELISEKNFGQINFIDSTRANLGLFQSDINVLWDLAPHDISICNFLLDEPPISVQAIGKSHTGKNIEDIAYLILHYNSKKIVHLNCSWISPIKIRKFIIGGTEKMVIFDDTNEKEKIQLFNTNFKEKSSNHTTDFFIEYNIGQKSLITFDQTEALETMASNFIDCIISKSIPISNHNIGLNVVKILEAAEKSIKNDGTKIPL